jgi:general secretion pathway protein G
MIQRNLQTRRRRSAFTLMEMLIVVAIIVALAGIGGFFIMGQLEGAKKDTAQIQVKAIATVCDAYRVKHNKYPDTLPVLLQKDEYGMIWMDDPNKLIDPWGRPYQYDASGQQNQGLHADVWTDPPDASGRIGNWPRMQNLQ